jgi:hypothetical protein
MNPIEKKKFEEEFLKTLIKYMIYENIVDIRRKTIQEEDFFES